MERLYGLDLFSGIGGLSLALSEWVRPIAYCENDRYAQSVLLTRMASHDIPVAPIWDDVTTLFGKHLPKAVDIIYGGFPCQDISVAGPGGGLGGKRSGLYWDIHRLVKEIKPSFVFLENVPAIRTRGLSDVVRSLTELGYDCRWTVVSAQEVGAPHIRKRWFLLAHANGLRLREEQQPQHRERTRSLQPNDSGSPQFMEDTTSVRLEEPRQTSPGLASAPTGASWWATEPDVGRVANGVPQRVDRLRGLGNAVVPLQAKTAFTRLLGLQE